MIQRTLVCALFFLIVPMAAGAAVDCADPDHDPSVSNKVFVVCHATERYWDGERWKQLAGGATIRVPAGTTVVEVAGTNTAVFDYRLSSEPVDVPEAKQLNAFLGAFGPYAIDVLETSVVEAKVRDLSPQSATAVADLENRLNELDRLIDDIQRIRRTVLAAYSSKSATAIASSIRGSVCGSEEECRTQFDNRVIRLLEKYEQVDAALSRLVGASPELETALLKEGEDMAQDLQRLTSAAEGDEKALEVRMQLIEFGQTRALVDDALKKLIATARKALHESQQVLELVRTVERAALDGLEAQDSWTSPPFPITLQKGRKVTLKITPKPIATLASAGRLPKVDALFTLLPRWAVRPAVGLSLLWADGAVFPEFGTRKTTETVQDEMKVERFEIVEKDFDDERFTYGLNLGLTARGLCTSKGKNCPWLDLIVNPSDDVKALGAGVSYNFQSIKIGVGALWTKHEVLDDDQRAGDLLMAEDELMTRDSYGSPEFFVSLSVIGWEPFVNDD